MRLASTVTLKLRCPSTIPRVGISKRSATLSGKPDEACLVFRERWLRLGWSFNDPEDANGSEAKENTAFCRGPNSPW